MATIAQKVSQSIYEIEVWYRYASCGEIEKDHEFHNVEAVSVQDAVNKAYELYRSRKSIPFAFYHENIPFSILNN